MDGGRGVMDSQLERIDLHVVAGIQLREEVYEMTTPEAGKAWAARAHTWYQEARTLVSPNKRHLRTLDILDELHLLPLSPDNHFWEPYKPISMVTSSTGEGRPGNNAANLHATRVIRLGEIARGWEVRPPESPIAATKPGRPVRGKPLEERSADWNFEMLKQPGRTYRDVARDIAKREGLPDARYVERETRRVRKERGKAGKFPAL